MCVSLSSTNFIATQVLNKTSGPQGRVCVCVSSWNQLETNGVWSVLLPRHCAREKEVRTSWLEYQGTWLLPSFFSVELTTNV